MSGRTSVARALALIVACVAATTASAAARRCPIANQDLQAALREGGATGVLTATRKDPDSDEPILRHVADYGGGATVVVEQQNCMIHNLRVTLLSAEEVPADADLRRLGTVLGATPVWRRYFARIDAAGFFVREVTSDAFRGARKSGSTFSYALDDRLSAADEHSEAKLSVMTTASYPAQYHSAISLYIGVGGE